MERAEEVLVALRRVIRAIDLHSKKLAQRHGLTGPQALVVKEVLRQGSISIGALARAISLSHATVTDIVKRLEKRQLLARNRATRDRRQVLITPTVEAERLMRHSIPLLQEKFIERFNGLAKWEQTQLLSSLEQIAAMMDAEEIEAAPILAIGQPEDADEMAELTDKTEI